MHGEWHALLYDLDKLHRAEILRAAEQRRLFQPAGPRRSLRRAAGAALFSLGGALVASGRALQAHAGDFTAGLPREGEPGAPQRRRASSY